MTTEQFIAAFNSRTPPAPYDALPNVTFAESVTLHLNGETLKVMHISNAHTDGDAIIFFKESNVIHTGDVFVRYGLPFIDQEHGGSCSVISEGRQQEARRRPENAHLPTFAWDRFRHGGERPRPASPRQQSRESQSPIPPGRANPT